MFTLCALLPLFDGMLKPTDTTVFLAFAGLAQR
jgi:hypothetical protein